VVAEHRDKAHAHIHIIVNCVHRRHRELSDVRVQAPGNPEFAGCARELGGSYEELKKEWVFPPEKRDEVDNLCKEVYGDISNAKIRCGKPIQAWWNRDHWKIIESTPCEMERVHGWREETRYRRSTKCPPPQKRGVRWELPRPTALGEAQEAGSASPRRDDGPGVFQLVGGKHPQRFAADYQTVNGGLESLGIGGCRVSIHDGKSLRPWVGCWS